MNRLPMPPAALKTLYGIVSPAAEETARKDERYRFQFALACLHAGEHGRAAEMLAAPFSPPVNAMADGVRAVLSSRPLGFWRRAALLAEDRMLDIQVTRTGNARATVIVPTGVFFGYQPVAMLDALLAAHRVNVIYLRDFNQRGFMRGIKSLGPDIETTIAALKNMVAGLGAPRVITMGSSLGGFAAARYGALLGAETAISFSGPTHALAAYDSIKSTVWNPAYFGKLLLSRERDIEFDNIPFIKPAAATRFIQYHGADAPDDAAHAQRLAGLPNVRVIAEPGVSDHAVVNRLIANGSFDKLVDQLVN